MVEADIASALDALFGGQVFPDEAPFDTPPPYVTYQQVGGDPLNFLEGVPDKRNGRFQFNVWATTRLEASGLIRQVEDLLRLDPRLLALTLTGAFSRRDHPLNLYGSQQDFSIWFHN